MEPSSFHLIEQASEISKITLSVIVYAPCPSKTIIKTNKKQMNSSADTFFISLTMAEEEKTKRNSQTMISIGRFK